MQTAAFFAFHGGLYDDPRHQRQVSQFQQIASHFEIPVILVNFVEQNNNSEIWSAKSAPTEWGDADIQLTLYRNGKFIFQIKFIQGDLHATEKGSFTRIDNSIVLHYNSGRIFKLECHDNLLIDKSLEGIAVPLKRKDRGQSMINDK